MGSEDTVAEAHKSKDEAHETGTIAVHSFSDLTYISPAVFLYLLKECYIRGTCKATKKFRVLQHQVHQVLHNGPRPGPSTFVVHCLYLLPIFEFHSEALSHLIISALRRLLKVETYLKDSIKAKDLAAQLFLNIVGGFIDHDERIVVKILEVFDVQLTNIEKVICRSKAKKNYIVDNAKAFVEHYVFWFIESQSYMIAVALLEHFSIRQSGKSLLLSMIHNNQFKAAEKWATFIGKPMLCVLIEEYVNRNMLKSAYGTIKKNDLRNEFPDIYQKCKESSLKKLAEKGCWDVAEAKTNNERQLLEYLVYLAMEAGYSEKVDELCNRYSLTGFVNAKVPEAILLHSHYLNLNELLVEDIIWVDKVDGLQKVTCNIEECKVLGLDCEWKADYQKGSKPNRVSIMQIAYGNMVFILDLIKLFENMPDVLNNCLTRILRSPRILKLGYSFQCDINQLAHSYEELECFKHYEMLLDIQRDSWWSLWACPVLESDQKTARLVLFLLLLLLFQKILGAGLNKTRRNSNWEQRPLTPNQLEYAALDAAVLIHIFSHLRNHFYTASVSERHERIEWKSYIISRMDNAKKKTRSKKRESRN